MITNGFRFHVGASLVLGLICTSAAVGDDPLFPGAQYNAGNTPASVAIGDLAPDLAVTNGVTHNVSMLLKQSPPECPADFDGNGSVGAFDLAILLGFWVPNPGHPADLDGDGAIGPADLAILLGNWGPCQ